jgi:hypothetical protein
MDVWTVWTDVYVYAWIVCTQREKVVGCENHLDELLELLCMHACVCMYECLHVCTYVWTDVDMYVWIVCAHKEEVVGCEKVLDELLELFCMYVCMYACMYVCIDGCMD